MSRQYNRDYMREYRQGFRRRQLADVVRLAREEHEARCACIGEACRLGAALARVAA